MTGRRSAARHMIRRRGRSTQNWKTFLRNHLAETVAIDFLTVPTVTFSALYVLVVLSLDRRRIVHMNVTAHPTAEWTAMQLTQAFPFDTAPRFIIRDRDKIYGEAVRQAIRDIGSEEIVISAQSPWQNGYCERVVGTLRRECLDHVIVFGERHARRILRNYLEYYHGSRTHLGLDKDTPDGRSIEPPELGPLPRIPVRPDRQPLFHLQGIRRDEVAQYHIHGFSGEIRFLSKLCLLGLRLRRRRVVHPGGLVVRRRGRRGLHPVCVRFQAPSGGFLQLHGAGRVSGVPDRQARLAPGWRRRS